MNRADIMQKVEIYDAFLGGDHSRREFHRSTIKNGKKFVALIKADGIIFIPAHYAVAPIEQLQQVEQKQTVTSAVDRTLNTQLEKSLSPGDPLYEVLDGFYAEYCAQSGDRPSMHHQARTYWLLRPPA